MMNNIQNEGFELHLPHASNTLSTKSLNHEDHSNSRVASQDTSSREMRGASTSHSSGRSKSASSQSSGRSSSRGRSVRSLSRESSLNSSASSSSSSSSSSDDGKSELELDFRTASKELSTKRAEHTPIPTSRLATLAIVNLHPAWLSDGLVPHVVSAAFQVLMDLYEACDGPRWRESAGWRGAADGSPPPTHVRVSYGRSSGPPASQLLHTTAASGARRGAEDFGEGSVFAPAADEGEAAARAALGRRQRRAGDRARAIVGAFAGWDGIELVDGYSHNDSNGAGGGDAVTGLRPSFWQGLPGLELDLSHMGLKNALPSNAFAYQTPPASPYGSSDLSHRRMNGSSSPLADTLVVLNLTANSLTGPLPISVSSLKRLKVLQVAHNAFTGTLPSGWLQPLKDLQTLNLSHNKLTGRVPQLWPNCAKLEVLDLSANRFSGRMPTKLSHLRFLRGLDLSHNAFEGPLPKVDLRQLRSLQYLRLHGNRRVVGVAPPSWRYFLKELRLDWDPDHLPSDASSLSSSSEYNDSDKDDDESSDKWHSEEDDASHSGSASGSLGNAPRQRQPRKRQQRSRTADPLTQQHRRGRIREGSQERPQSSDSDSAASSDPSAAEEQEETGHSDSSNSDIDSGFGGTSYNDRSNYSGSSYAGGGGGQRFMGAGGGGGGYATPGGAGLRQGGINNEGDGWNSSRSGSENESDDEEDGSDHGEVGGRGRSGFGRRDRRRQRPARLLGGGRRRSNTSRRGSAINDCAPS